MNQSPSLNEAISLVETGELEQAGVLLAECIRNDPNNLEAWTWLARCVRTERQQDWCKEQIARIKARQAGTPLSDKPGKLNLGDRYRRTPWLVLLILVFAGLTLLGAWWLTGRTTLIGASAGPANAGAHDAEAAQELPVPLDLAAELPLGRENDRLDQWLTSGISVNSEHLAYLPGLFSAEATQIPEPAAVEVTKEQDPRPNPKKWKSYPIVPYISQSAMNIWEKGVKAGNDPHAFSVIGDCQSAPNVLFERFEDTAYQDDPAYRPYRKTLKFFQGSWNRYYITVDNGMSVASVFNPLWARNPACKAGESPIKCELRLHNPSILIISLGTNWGGRNPDEFEDYLRQMIDFALEKNVLPIIVTKGDPAGSNNPLNERMVKVAYDYDIPLWNFWAAIQDLPNQGLNPWDRGGVYLAVEAWTVKRDTGLMMLDAVRKKVSGN
ncbi:MAG: hypothetical protein ACK2UW_15140 [Anaerolineales bacterium]